MDLIKIIQNKKKIISASVLIFLLISLIATFIQPLKYRAQAQVLVVQNFDQNIDAYSASKLNEYLGGILAKVVASESFFNQTVKAGFNVDTGYFAGNKKKQVEKWNKTVQAKSLYDSGIISISVYHPDKDQAEKIAQATIYTLKTTNNFYHSISNVDVRIIDSPSVSSLPVKPNIALNVIVGILFGLAVGVLLAYRQEEKKLINAINPF